MAGRKWSEQEIDYLKSNYGKIKSKDIAVTLGRTKRSVFHMIGILGLEKKFIEIGDKFGTLTIIDLPFLVAYHGQQKSRVKVKCDCGVEKEVFVAYLKYNSSLNNTISCGCIKSEKARKRTIKRNTIHGRSNSKIFKHWCSMKSRCYTPSNNFYYNYGGRGITICKEWLENFINFYNWSLENGYKPGLTIDRIDVNGHYCPENCRWADNNTQANNKRSNRYINAFGEVKTASEWSKDSRCKTSYWSLCYRIKRNWDSETAITTPLLDKERYLGKNLKGPNSEKEKYFNIVVEAFGEEKTLTDWANDKRCVVSYDLLAQRYRFNWDMEQAINTPSKNPKHRNILPKNYSKQLDETPHHDSTT